MENKMETKRKSELHFLLRTDSHIKLHRENDNDAWNYDDYFTMRELVDEGVFGVVCIDSTDSIVFETLRNVKIAKPKTDFEFQEFPKGKTFKMGNSPYLFKLFQDMVGEL